MNSKITNALEKYIWVHQRILMLNSSDLWCRNIRSKVFLQISQNSQENTCARVHLCLRPAALLKKRPQQRSFPANFAKILRTPFLWNTSGGCLFRYNWWPAHLIYGVHVVRKFLYQSHNSFWFGNHTSSIIPTV